MVCAFGDVGCPRTFLIDFETAAIHAIQANFPESTVKSCSFHFRQAVLRRVQREGLQTSYEDLNSPLRNWIRHLMSMTALPVFAIPVTWSWMKDPPKSGDSAVDAKARSLAGYFDRTWINGDFKPEMCSHYDSLGPRTTNLAEGWHNGLNRHFGMRTWAKVGQFATACDRDGSFSNARLSQAYRYGA